MSAGDERKETSRTRHVDEAVGRRLRDLREALGLTRRQVAADMGASEGRWQAYESGERIPASRIWQFCSRYGLDVGDLYAGLPFTIGPVAAPVAPPGALAEPGVEPGAGKGGPADGTERRRMGGMAETGAPFEPAPDASLADDTMQAISAAAAALNPLERSLALAALRGMGARKLKQP
jgi:DNA-binding XRE family transcriptional regulator